MDLELEKVYDLFVNAEEEVRNRAVQLLKEAQQTSEHQDQHLYINQ